MHSKQVFAGIPTLAFFLPLALLLPGIAFAQSNSVKQKGGSLDHLIVRTSLWDTTILDFGKVHQGFGFTWLSSSKEGVRSVHPSLSLNGQRVGETVIRAKEGKLSQISISIFNRGDNGVIPVGDFRKLEGSWLAYMEGVVGSKPEDTSASRDAVAGQTRLVWHKGPNTYILESSVTRYPEFLRLLVEPKPSGAGYLGGGTARVSARRSDLPKNVVRDANGDVYIAGIPMVDQGEKGYCAVASAERVFRYYGLQVDQHDLAQISQSSAAVGTSPERMIEALGTVASKVKLRPQTLIEWDTAKFIREVENYNRAAAKMKLQTYNLRRFSFEEYYSTVDPDLFREIRTKGTVYRSFQSSVARSIDQGIPLLWGLELGVYPEPDIPQARGGHMRLIIGYNSRNQEVIYSDSWGEGHAKKKMPMGDAYSVTNGLYTLNPAH